MQRSALYDIVSLTLLIVVGIALLAGLFFALREIWLKASLFAAGGLAVWHMSANFARLAIAASGRQ